MLTVGNYLLRNGMMATVSRVRMINRQYYLSGWIMSGGLPYLNSWHANGSQPGNNPDYDLVTLTGAHK